MLKRLTTGEFIAKAVAVHGVGRYDYSQTVYVKGSVKLLIVCPTHGLFSQEAASHLMGNGCKLCAHEANRVRFTNSASAFIAKARKIHGDKYDYSQVIYVSCKQRVKIICPIHGIFEQRPIKHTSDKKSGCTQCAIIVTAKKIVKDTLFFIKEARKIHGDKYDYSQVIYTKSSNRVKIICPIHGVFEQQACTHILRGVRKASGCPACGFNIVKSSWADRNNGKNTCLYFIRLFNDSENFYKIGVTAESVERRYTVATLGGYNFELLAIHISNNAFAVYEWEQSILESFRHIRYWPKNEFTGATECFSSADEILAIFPL